jgi:SAM-dependent methyltransferase
LISRDDVIWSYRIMLGREPESEGMIREQMQFPDLWSLRQALLRSTEFQAQLARLRLEGCQFVTGSLRPSNVLPPNKIQLDVSPLELDSMWGHIQRSWEALGKEQPYYSVLSASEFLPDRFEENVEKFWSTGASEFDLIQRMLEKFAFRNQTEKICTELGCGVGRVSIPLAAAFKQVNAYDISRSHLAVAEARALMFGYRNMICTLLKRVVLDSLPPSDFIYSKLVLQHNPPPLMEIILQGLLKSLNGDGLAIIQMPTYIMGYEFSVKEYLGRDELSGIEMHCLPQGRLFEIIQRCGCRLEEIREDVLAGNPEVILSNTVIVSRQ